MQNVPKASLWRHGDISLKNIVELLKSFDRLRTTPSGRLFHYSVDYLQREAFSSIYHGTDCHSPSIGWSGFCVASTLPLPVWFARFTVPVILTGN